MVLFYVLRLNSKHSLYASFYDDQARMTGAFHHLCNGVTISCLFVFPVFIVSFF